MRLQRMALVGALAAAVGVATAPAAADEEWDSTVGRIVYQVDIGSTAVWSYPPHDERPGGLLVFDDLGGVFTGRGTHAGVWIADGVDGAACATAISDPEGRETPYWGRVEIRFVDPDFPSRWVLDWARCDGPRQGSWKAYPVTAF
ncbi:MAG: hypothetical protein GVY28_14010 [Alphaproteobacteria bacterium]|jgi:hypothetical protein|nr:hypothetical protein [Alphaproteobacteria bacterium]